MAEILSLHDAVAAHVRDGQTVALEGFTHLIPFAAGHEVIRQGRRDLTLVRMTPDLVYDQMIGMGCASTVVFSFAGNPGVGSLRRMRDAVEHGWPHPVRLVEHSHAAMAAAWDAGAAGLPFAMLRHGYAGSGLREVNDDIRAVTCPFTGEELAAVPALHARRRDRARPAGGPAWQRAGRGDHRRAEAGRAGLGGVDRDGGGGRGRPGRAVAELLHHPGMGDRRGVRGPQRGPSVLHPRLLRPRQRLLHGLGRDRRRP